MPSADRFTAIGQLRPFAPFQRFRHFGNTLFDAYAVEDLAGGRPIPLFESILQSEFNRIHPQLFGQHIHLRFDGPGNLLHAHTA